MQLGTDPTPRNQVTKQRNEGTAHAFLTLMQPETHPPHPWDFPANQSATHALATSRRQGHGSLRVVLILAEQKGGGFSREKKKEKYRHHGHGRVTLVSCLSTRSHNYSHHPPTSFSFSPQKWPAKGEGIHPPHPKSHTPASTHTDREKKKN